MEDFRKVRNISTDLVRYYREYYLRNTYKFFGKWRLGEEDLDKLYTKDDEDFLLIGQVSDNTFILNKISDDTKWFIKGDLFTTDFKRKE